MADDLPLKVRHGIVAWCHDPNYPEDPDVMKVLSFHGYEREPMPTDWDHVREICTVGPDAHGCDFDLVKATREMIEYYVGMEGIDAPCLAVAALDDEE